MGRPGPRAGGTPSSSSHKGDPSLKLGFSYRAPPPKKGGNKSCRINPSLRPSLGKLFVALSSILVLSFLCASPNLSTFGQGWVGWAWGGGLLSVFLPLKRKGSSSEAWGQGDERCGWEPRTNPLLQRGWE